MITKENAKDWLPLVRALADGKKIQYQAPVTNDWYTTARIDPNGEYPEYYRIAPEPKRVPLTAEDIPAVCWVRQQGISTQRLITSVDCEGIDCDFGWLSFETLSDNKYQYSTDRKEWVPFSKEGAQ